MKDRTVIIIVIIVVVGFILCCGICCIGYSLSEKNEEEREEPKEPTEAVPDIIEKPDTKLKELEENRELIEKWAGREDEAINVVKRYPLDEPFTDKYGIRRETINGKAKFFEKVAVEVADLLGNRSPIFKWEAKHLPYRTPSTYIVSHKERSWAGEFEQSFSYNFWVDMETGLVEPKDEPTRLDFF